MPIDHTPALLPPICTANLIACSRIRRARVVGPPQGPDKFRPGRPRSFGHALGDRRSNHLWHGFANVTFTQNQYIMLRWTLAFLVIAIIAAVFGFGGVAAGAAGIAKVLFFIFLVLFVLSLIRGSAST